MYIVAFNGPPRSGKDTMARMLAEHMDSQGVYLPLIETSLSTPLRRLAYQMVGREYIPETYEAFKLEVFPQFNNATGRQLMIDVSERFLKPCYGESIMANMLLGELAEIGFPQDGIVLVRDSGFQCEVNPLIDAVGPDNLYVVRVDRAGCTFDGDSREWVTHTQMGSWLNRGTLDTLRGTTERLFLVLRDRLGWKL